MAVSQAPRKRPTPSCAETDSTATVCRAPSAALPAPPPSTRSAASKSEAIDVDSSSAASDDEQAVVVDDNAVDELDGDEDGSDEDGNDGSKRGPWTEAERDKLFKLADENTAPGGRIHLLEVIAHMDGRDQVSCRNQLSNRQTHGRSSARRWHPWTAEDDALLMTEADRKPRRSMEQISEQLGRTITACNQRVTVLRAQRSSESGPGPGASSSPRPAGRPWSEATTALLMAEVDRDRPWAEIHALFPSRTPKACEQKASEVKKSTGSGGQTGRRASYHPRARWEPDERQALFSLYDSNVDADRNADWDRILPNFPARTLGACLAQVAFRKDETGRPCQCGCAWHQARGQEWRALTPSCLFPQCE